MKDLISNTNLKLKEFYENEYTSIDTSSTQPKASYKPPSVKKAFDYNCFLFLLDDFTNQITILEESRVVIEV